MAEPLKNYFSSNVPVILAQNIQSVYADFNSEGFIKQALTGFNELELIPRGKKLAHDLKPFLPESFSEAVSILKKTMNQQFTHTDYGPMSSFFYMPHLNFVAFYGLNDFETSMETLHFMTQRFSAEFAIRPFIETYPELAFKRFHEWKKDPNVHVRRLVSEGTRPLLPWASRLRDLEKDPSPSIPLLEFLKDDPELYVRRSVANHLNDISKNQPELVIELCQKWVSKPTEERLWVIKQALRTLIKKGNSEAIRIFGFDNEHDFNVTQSHLSETHIQLGEKIEMQFEIHNDSDQPKKALVDFVVHFTKANGETKPKVFKLTTANFEANEKKKFTKVLTFQNLTTRKHYAGKHKIELLINGTTFLIGFFDLHI